MNRAGREEPREASRKRGALNVPLDSLARELLQRLEKLEGSDKEE